MKAMYVNNQPINNQNSNSMAPDDKKKDDKKKKSAKSPIKGIIIIIAIALSAYGVYHFFIAKKKKAE